MRLTFSHIFRCLGAIALACSLMGATPAPRTREPATPEEMYKLAVRQMDRSNFVRALELFERIKTRYPFSKFAALSELRIADSQFRQSNYPEAIDAYQAFIKLHPRHPELDYVFYQIGRAEFKQSPSNGQRDQTPTRRMLTVLQTYEERFPKSEHLDEVQKMRTQGRDRLARGVFGIGQYYYRRARFESNQEERIAACNAAITRFEQVVAEYPDVPDVNEDALYHKGLCQTKLNRRQEALETSERLRARFPKSREADKLARRAGRIKGKPMYPTLPADVKDEAPGATLKPGTPSSPEEQPGLEPVPETPLDPAPEAAPETPLEPTPAPEFAPRDPFEATPEARPSEPVPGQGPSIPPETSPDTTPQ